MAEKIFINLDSYSIEINNADEISETILNTAGFGSDIVLEGDAPAWFCFKLALELLPSCASLSWQNAELGLIEVVNHNPF